MRISAGSAVRWMVLLSKLPSPLGSRACKRSCSIRLRTYLGGVKPWLESRKVAVTLAWAGWSTSAKTSIGSVALDFAGAVSS